MQEELIRLHQVESVLRRRLMEFRTEAYGLALRVGYGHIAEAGETLAAALNETVLASDRVQRELVTLAARRATIRGHDHDAAERGARLQLGHMRAAWLHTLRARLRRQAAETHREAQRARNRADEPRAIPLFAMKNRFEFLADAFGTIIEVDGAA